MSDQYQTYGDDGPAYGDEGPAYGDEGPAYSDEGTTHVAQGVYDDVPYSDSHETAEFAEEAEFVGENDLLEVSKCIGEEYFDNFHPITHIETDEKIVEDEEL